MPLPPCTSSVTAVYATSHAGKRLELFVSVFYSASRISGSRPRRYGASEPGVEWSLSDRCSNDLLPASPSAWKEFDVCSEFERVLLASVDLRTLHL